MMWDEAKVQAKIEAADTVDLLDRVTAYRKGMEPEAVEMMERELRRRGVSAADIAAHREQCERECVFFADGVAAKCSFCDRPAIDERWGWHKVFSYVPLFPRWLRRCRQHTS